MCPYCAPTMPRPRNEREAWTEELAELAEQLASYRRELNAVPPVSRERREGLEWQIRRVEKRMAELEVRLAKRAPPPLLTD